MRDKNVTNLILNLLKVELEKNIYFGLGTLDELIGKHAFENWVSVL